MKNSEKYFSEIIKEMENLPLDCSIYKARTREKICHGDCYKCKHDSLVWLSSECDETILSQQEYEILKNIPKKWKWIARDDEWENHCSLYIYTTEPERDDSEWLASDEYGNHMKFELYEDLFKFITWETKAFSIEELIRKYEVKYGK